MLLLAREVFRWVIVPPEHRIVIDFVELIYGAALGPWMDDQYDMRDIILVEDGAPVHRSRVLKIWR